MNNVLIYNSHFLIVCLCFVLLFFTSNAYATNNNSSVELQSYFNCYRNTSRIEEEVTWKWQPNNYWIISMSGFYLHKSNFVKTFEQQNKEKRGKIIVNYQPKKYFNLEIINKIQEKQRENKYELLAYYETYSTQQTNELKGTYNPFTNLTLIGDYLQVKEHFVEKNKKQNNIGVQYKFKTSYEHQLGDFITFKLKSENISSKQEYYNRTELRKWNESNLQTKITYDNPKYNFELQTEVIREERRIKHFDISGDDKYLTYKDSYRLTDRLKGMLNYKWRRLEFECFLGRGSKYLDYGEKLSSSMPSNDHWLDVRNFKLRITFSFNNKAKLLFYNSMQLQSYFFEDAANHNDRDELVSSSLLQSTYKFNSNLRTVLILDVKESHSKYIKKEMSANNRINHFYTIKPILYYDISSNWELTQQFIWRANYTIYDFNSSINTLFLTQSIKTQVEFNSKILDLKFDYNYEQKLMGKYDIVFEASREQIEHNFLIETEYYPFSKNLSLGPGYEYRYTN